MRPSRYAGSLMYSAGVSGTLTLEPGDRIVEITAQTEVAANGTVEIFGGPPIAVIGAAAPDTKLIHLGPYPDDARFEASDPGAGFCDIIFLNTVAYSVAFMRLRPVAPV